jgi:hypothetical protein
MVSDGEEGRRRRRRRRRRKREGQRFSPSVAYITSIS